MNALKFWWIRHFRKPDIQCLGEVVSEDEFRAEEMRAFFETLAEDDPLKIKLRRSAEGYMFDPPLSNVEFWAKKSAEVGEHISERKPHEGIREGIAKKICPLVDYEDQCVRCSEGKGCPDEWEDIAAKVDSILTYLDSQGVVLKVEGTPLFSFTGAGYNPQELEGYQRAQREMRWERLV